MRPAKTCAPTKGEPDHQARLFLSGRRLLPEASQVRTCFAR
jgi:hypothetical protein